MNASKMKRLGIAAQAVQNQKTEMAGDYTARLHKLLMGMSLNALIYPEAIS